ncbi:MAG: retropepsin-like domain-containing protein [Candidatus Eremiobacteraeota bacterium]|nr:retropepsin-like domain-containing protein [Candidatus Eremiobacteraeota bacterium]
MMLLQGILAALLAMPLFTSAATTPQVIPSRFPGRILIPAVINGHTLWFHLDTGTNGLFIDAGAAAQAGMKLDMAGHSASADIDVGTLHASDARFGLLGRYGYDDGGVHVSGLIGTPFFDSNVVTLDYPHEQVIVYPNHCFDPRTTHVAPTPIDLTNVARVRAWFGGKEARMLLDTGSQRTILFESFARNVIVGPPISPEQRITIGIGAAPTYEREYRTKPFIFGGLQITQMTAIVADAAPDAVPESRYDGILGRDIYPEFRITLDYDDRVIYLQPEP